MISELLASIIYKLRPKREADFPIGPNSEDPYMNRWFIIPRNRFFNIYMHQMFHDDDDGAPHDHPWKSLSLCLKGVIKEYQTVGPDDINIKYVEFIIKGMWKFRGTGYIHRLELPQGEAWTLFFTGPVVQEWGFYCPLGFKPWRQYIAINPATNERRGCGEID